MDIFEPKTWSDFDTHPEISKLGDRSWRTRYAGDVGNNPDTALEAVRIVAMELRSLMPDINTELVVLDSLSWYVAISGGGIEGELGFWDDGTVCLRLDMDKKESLYEDEVSVDNAAKLIVSHFGITPEKLD